MCIVYKFMDAWLLVLLVCNTMTPCTSQLTQQSPNGYIYPPPDSTPPNTQPLFFGLVMSFGGILKSSGVIPGVQVALDLVNNKSGVGSSLLKGYTLHYQLYDSQVHC